MASIQELGIIHHDLKSENVLLDQYRNSQGKYVLTGFLFYFYYLFFIIIFFK